MLLHAVELKETAELHIFTNHDLLHKKSCSNFLIDIFYWQTLAPVHKTCWLTSENVFSPWNCQKIEYSTFSRKKRLCTTSLFLRHKKSWSNFVIDIFHGQTLAPVHRTCWLTSENLFSSWNCERIQKIGFPLFSIRITCNNISFPQALKELLQLCDGQVSRANTCPSSWNTLANLAKLFSPWNCKKKRISPIFQ